MKAITSFALCVDLANNVHLENSLRSCARSDLASFEILICWDPQSLI